MSMDADRSFRAAGPFAAAAVLAAALAVLVVLLVAAPPAAAQAPPAAAQESVAERQAREVPLYAHPPEATPGPGCPFAGTPPNPQYPGICHPYPQPRPAGSQQTTTGCPGDCFTNVVTGAGI
ncbi:MAG TPA: hypothetical protein VF100_09045, partial [Thermoanaerobaculia bacterium]